MFVAGASVKVWCCPTGDAGIGGGDLAFAADEEAPPKGEGQQRGRPSWQTWSQWIGNLQVARNWPAVEALNVMVQFGVRHPDRRPCPVGSSATPHHPAFNPPHSPPLPCRASARDASRNLTKGRDRSRLVRSGSAIGPEPDGPTRVRESPPLAAGSRRTPSPWCEASWPAPPGPGRAAAKKACHPRKALEDPTQAVRVEAAEATLESSPE